MAGEFSSRRAREAAEAQDSSGGETKSRPVRDALSAVNPIVVGIYAIHVVALAVLYVSAAVDFGLTWPTLGLAVLSVVELVAVKTYLDQREAVHNARQQNSAPGGRPAQQGPYKRVDSGSGSGGES